MLTLYHRRDHFGSFSSEKAHTDKEREALPNPFVREYHFSGVGYVYFVLLRCRNQTPESVVRNEKVW
jgi:hypothetical protein